MSKKTKISEFPFADSIANECVIPVVQFNRNYKARVDTFLNRSKIWNGKQFTAFGTSITSLCINYDGGYLETIRQICGFASYENFGISGAPMVNCTENGNGINYAIKNAVINGELILIECCTNDFKLNVPVGLINTDNVDTFSGALKDAIKYIFTYYPNKQVIIIADPQRDNAGYDIDYINAAGCRLIDYIDMAILIGNEYGIPVCDLYRNGGINIVNIDTFTVDGLHPNSIGYELIGKCVSGIINSANAGSIVNTPNIDGEIQIDGEWYDITETAKCKYKMIIKISGEYYLYQSHMPIWIYSDGEAYYEAFDATMASRLTVSDGKFTNPQGFQLTGLTQLDDIFYRTNSARTINQFIAANHDVYIYGTNQKILRKSFD